MGQGSRGAERPEWYFTNNSTTPSDAASQSPTYPTQTEPNTNTKL
eukprot:CAMPEP_0205849002 /NCGR_PEP_ID=MMETSP1019-20131125/920_1 /ASSEMBLY_ACC=CAM_ASM_000403 /TAXON_ID=46462 /ORGANISM="Anophryoides haemophila, Strain AH6" /LENGTH=44 /DNA_ID= /DNA_START= /DNA_END= /DNA_ORIENTATION=